MLHGSGSAAQAAVHIMTNDAGITGPTLSEQDIIYFGFGDAGTTNQRGRISAAPEGFIVPVPEPATMFMSLAAMLTWTLRRASPAR